MYGDQRRSHRVGSLLPDDPLISCLSYSSPHYLRLLHWPLPRPTSAADSQKYVHDIVKHAETSGSIAIRYEW
jgi:hypothetical protein